MICRKIEYTGQFNDQVTGEIFDIIRKIEISGVVTKHSSSSMELLLQGDPSMIKLAQHKIERRAKEAITHKVITVMSFQNLSGLDFKEL